MMPVLLRFAKMLGAFAVLWIFIWLYTRFSFLKIESREMEPTLKGETHKMADPKIGSINDLNYDDLVSYSYNIVGRQPTFAARVIGLPGDRVEIRQGDVYVNGSKIGANYVLAWSKNDAKEHYAEIIVPRDTVYVLCDNRRAFDKSDSRALGPVGMWAINGKFK